MLREVLEHVRENFGGFSCPIYSYGKRVEWHYFHVLTCEQHQCYPYNIDVISSVWGPGGKQICRVTATDECIIVWGWSYENGRYHMDHPYDNTTKVYLSDPDLFDKVYTAIRNCYPRSNYVEL